MQSISGQLIPFLTNHWLLTTLLVVAVVLLLGNEAIFKWRGIPKISPQELIKLINHDNAFVVDMRPVGDYKNGHITGSKNIPQEELLNKLENASDDKTRPVVLVCANGQKAPLLGVLLKKKGYTQISYLDKGLTSWRQDNLPLVKG